MNHDYPSLGPNCRIYNTNVNDDRDFVDETQEAVESECCGSGFERPMLIGYDCLILFQLHTVDSLIVCETGQATAHTKSPTREHPNNKRHTINGLMAESARITWITNNSHNLRTCALLKLHTTL